MKKTKGSVHQFVTRAARAIWPERRSMHRLGVLGFGICALLGVTQASNIQRMLSGSVESASASQARLSKTSTSAAPAVVNNVTASATETEAGATTPAPNIVELIGDSEYIVRGLIKEVTDGFENGLPYTQVTVKVSETFRGPVGAEYTFRQFGLTKPRKMDNGKMNLMVTPDGWSKYNSNEDVVLFLRKKAQKSGLQTTAGLGQGKIAINAGNAVSQFDNFGLFEKVQVDDRLLNDRDKRLLATKKGPVNTESFISFVRRAMKNKWIEGGKMRNVKK